MQLLYDLFLRLYLTGIRIYALFNDKAKRWLTGRRNWQATLRRELAAGEKRIWIHSSSVGEFEQVRPVVEALRQRYPRYKIVVTFFSPSGYEATPKNDFIDHIFYLPMDGRNNAKAVVGLIDPAMVIFAKYEFWYYYLHEVKQRGIPTLLVSAVFRPEQAFFKWYGGLFRDMLRCFDFFFVQNHLSRDLLAGVGFTNVLVSGDTRYDRVAEIAAKVTPIIPVERFKGSSKILIAGSSWPGDEAVLKSCMSLLPDNWKVIIAPHEVDAGHVSNVRQLFAGESILYSELSNDKTGADKRVLIINNIGMLSRLFAYGDVAFIGGGFQRGGIHNVLEPAVFGLPVIFGPVYEKFIEAKELATAGYGFPVKDADECRAILGKLVGDDAHRATLNAGIRRFMEEHRGAAAAVVYKIGQESWLR